MSKRVIEECLAVDLRDMRKEMKDPPACGQALFVRKGSPWALVAWNIYPPRGLQDEGDVGIEILWILSGATGMQAICRRGVYSDLRPAWPGQADLVCVPGMWPPESLAVPAQGRRAVGMPALPSAHLYESDMVAEMAQATRSHLPAATRLLAPDGYEAAVEADL
jgi:hypothetical protein